MATLSFTAHCARDHERQDFTDRAAFEAHMTTEHKAKRLRVGGPVTAGWNAAQRCAPGWTTGGKFEPYPWQAPPAPKDTRRLTTTLVEYSGSDHLDSEWQTDDVVSPDDLRLGDVFLVGRHTYTVLEVIDGGGLRLSCRRTGKREEPREGRLRLEQIKAKAPTVALVKRAA